MKNLKQKALKPYYSSCKNWLAAGDLDYIWELQVATSFLSVVFLFFFPNKKQSLLLNN